MTKFKLKVILVLVLVGSSVFLTSCNKPNKPKSLSAQTTLQKIQKEGVIRVGYVNYPPTVIKDPNSQELSGHFIDAAKFLAKVMDVDIEFVEADWSTFVSGLQSGQFDLSIAATYRTIPRAMAVAFSQPIMYIGNSAVVKDGDLRFDDLDDLNQTGIKIAVAQGEASHEYAREHFSKAEIIVLSTSDLSQPLTQVLSGRADVGLADAWTVSKFAREHKAVKDLFENVPYDLTPIGWAVRQGDVEFLNFINVSLDYLESTGRMVKWERKYDAHWVRPRIFWETIE